MVASAVKVFKKTSPNGKVNVYMGKRDFVDHLDHVDPIEGVVVVENEYLKGRKVYCQVPLSFHSNDLYVNQNNALQLFYDG